MVQTRRKMVRKPRRMARRSGRKINQYANRQIAPYGARGVAYAGALATGALRAYRYRNAIRAATNIVRRKFARSPNEPNGSHPALTVPREVSVVGQHTISYNKATYGKFPKLKPDRLFKMIHMGFTDRIDRFQGVTNFDNNVGWFPLANRIMTSVPGTTDTPILMPMHIYQLTDFDVNGRTVPRTVGFGVGFQDVLSGTDYRLWPLQGQNPDGSTAVTTWDDQRPYSKQYTDKVLHAWTSINLNLYGARQRTTHFYIDFIRFRDTDANFVNGFPGSDPNPVANRVETCNEVIEYLTHNLIYSNLISRDQKAKRFIDVVKSYRYEIAPELTTDVSAVTGKIKNVKLFMRHGRIYDMYKDDNGNAGSDLDLNRGEADGADYSNAELPSREVKERAKLYMIIRTNAFTRRSATEASWLTGGGFPNHPTAYVGKDIAHTIAVAATEPSYDIVLRNKYQYIPKFINA